MHAYRSETSNSEHRMHTHSPGSNCSMKHRHPTTSEAKTHLRASRCWLGKRKEPATAERDRTTTAATKPHKSPPTMQVPHRDVPKRLLHPVRARTTTQRPNTKTEVVTCSHPPPETEPSNTCLMNPWTRALHCVRLNLLLVEATATATSV